MDDNNEIRQAWTPSNAVQIFSNSKQKWFDGEIASVFHDEEGEWLEIRYDKSMSKQVQRYSSDIRPSPDDIKKLKLRKPKGKTKKTSTDGFPFPEPEMKNKSLNKSVGKQDRTSWTKGFEVEIFSNTHQQWYLGEIVDIIKDEEGEWLNVVWARANGEAMSKQVQRFSTDVRPAQNENDSDNEEIDPNGNNSSTQSEVARTNKLSVQIQKRKNNFRRGAPPFSRTLKPSTFQYPATANARRLRKLIDIEEKFEDKDQLLLDNNISSPILKKIIKKKPILKISTWKTKQVQQFIRSMGKEYGKYMSKFRGMSGKRFLTLTETDLQKLKIPKLHCMKILLSIAKNSNDKKHEFIHEINSGDVLNWTPADVGQWMSSQQSIIGQYRQKFIDHGIDGLLLFDLDDEDLLLMNILKKAHRNKIKKVIIAFKHMCFNTDEQKERKEEDSNILEIRTRNMRRKSIQILNIDSITSIGNGNRNDNEVRDDLLISMANLMIELGKVINAGEIPILTDTVQRKLTLYIKSMVNEESTDINMNDQNSNSNNIIEIDPKAQVISRIKAANSENDMSAIGLGLNTNAWLKSQSNDYVGHKRRGSLPYLNSNLLSDITGEDDDDDDEDEDDESVSDLD